MSCTINFFNIGDPSTVSGGYIYNNKVIDFLKDHEYTLTYHYDSQSLKSSTDKNVLICDSLAISAQSLTCIEQFSNLILLYHLPPELRPDCDVTHKQLDKLISKSKQIIVTGSPALNYMIKTYPHCRSKLHLVTPGVPSGWRRKERYSPTAQRLLVVSNIVPNKGYENLIDFLSNMLDVNWQLDVYGSNTIDSNYSHTILSKLSCGSLSNRVTYRGYTDQKTINTIMCESDLLLQPSQFETYSMVTAEAIASGLPVLSSQTGDMGSFSKSAHIRYIDVNHPETWEAQLKALILDPRAYASLCDKSGDAPITWQETGNRFIEVLKKQA